MELLGPSSQWQASIVLAEFFTTCSVATVHGVPQTPYVLSEAQPLPSQRSFQPHCDSHPFRTNFKVSGCLNVTAYSGHGGRARARG